ncbi:UNVERIFIED_CONTAM: hypothetical protein K2H54_067225 [Gekko kuhli]
MMCYQVARNPRQLEKPDWTREVVRHAQKVTEGDSNRGQAGRVIPFSPSLLFCRKALGNRDLLLPHYRWDRETIYTLLCYYVVFMLPLLPAVLNKAVVHHEQDLGQSKTKKELICVATFPAFLNLIRTRHREVPPS